MADQLHVDLGLSASRNPVDQVGFADAFVIICDDGVRNLPLRTVERYIPARSFCSRPRAGKDRRLTFSVPSSQPLHLQQGVPVFLHHLHRQDAAFLQRLYDRRGEIQPVYGLLIGNYG